MIFHRPQKPARRPIGRPQAKGCTLLHASKEKTRLEVPDARGRYESEGPEHSMRSSSARLVVATLSLLSMCSTLTAAGAAHGGVRGAVTDDSGGVLPGVVVVAT